MSKNYEIGALTHVGVKRAGKPNQDAIEVVLPKMLQRKPPLLILADGMGGRKGGEVASRLVLEAVKSVFEDSKDGDYLKALETGIVRAHFMLQDEASKNEELAGMGSTVVTVVLEEDKIHLANVGDSRAYLFRGDEALQLSYDHSWINEQLIAGVITEGQAKKHPKRNVLTMSISARRDNVQSFKGSFDTYPGDVLALCSDGLWGTVSKAQIKAIATEMPPQQAAEKLINLANASHSPDNISVIVAAIH